MTLACVDCQSPGKSKIYTIHTSLLFDARNACFLRNRSITVNRLTGLIESLQERESFEIPQEPSSRVQSEGAIDARGLTILPGLVDSHTHIFLHPYAETPSLNQERDESIVERIVRSTQHCRAALKAGYTSYRDLGTEGVSDADVGLRDSINRGLTPGPRLFVATQPLASSGSYKIQHESGMNGTRVPPISDPCDGVDGVTAGVRRRIGAGADIIKFYANYRRRTLRFPAPIHGGGPEMLNPPILKFRSPNSTLYNQAEMKAICDEAQRTGVPVAAHASEPEAVIMAAKAGVRTIEHGFVPSQEAIEQMLKNKTIFVPTLSVAYIFKEEVEKGILGDGITYKDVLAHTKAAWDAGISIAAGGDTGTFAHGDKALEIELLVEAGLTIEAALQAATIRGWEACGGNIHDEHEGESIVGKKFGCIEPSWTADFVALEGDPRDDIAALRRVHWVIKDGRFVIRRGRVLDGVGP